MDLLSRRRKILSLLSEHIEAYLPQFEPYTTDYQMVVYACRDLEAWIECNWMSKDSVSAFEKFEETLYYRTGEFKAFLNLWVGYWLEKWRERVRILSTKPKMPPFHIEKYKKARKLYLNMEQRKELKKMIIRKLINHGEICMCEFIAENLIIEEIAKRMQSTDKKIEEIRLDPLEILNSLTPTISRLPQEKGPLLYLNLKTYML